MRSRNASASTLPASSASGSTYTGSLRSAVPASERSWASAAPGHSRAASTVISTIRISALQEPPQALQIRLELALQPPLHDRDQHPRREPARLGVERLRQPRATSVGLERIPARELHAVGLEARLGAPRGLVLRDLKVKLEPARDREPLDRVRADAEPALHVVAVEISRPLRHLVLLEQPREDLGRRPGHVDRMRERGHEAPGYPPAGLGPRTGRSGTTSAIAAGSSPRSVATSRSSAAIREDICLSASAIGSGRCSQSASGPSGRRPSTRTGWPGLPTTVEFGGASWITTVLAPIFAPWPIVIGPSSFAPEPIVTLSCTVGWRLPVSNPVPPSVTPW